MRLQRSALRIRSQRGMSLIELMISMAVLVTGMAALLGLIMTAIANNGKAKVDTGATLVSQMVIEALAAQTDTSATITLTDCTNGGPIGWVVSGAPGNGATLTAAGGIDFSQAYAAVPATYKMTFGSCGPNGTSYDVRWNVTAGPTAYSRFITVSARPLGMPAVATASSARMYVAPVTLRTIALTNSN
jgi:prepilin-type N-terminal cleavage/methylation domain-containing protein